jgi:putative addiction module antidote
VAVLKLIQIGNSVGVIFPKDLLAKLKVDKGDSVFTTETPDGVALTAHDPGFEEQINAARDIMRKRRNVLRELAK